MPYRICRTFVVENSSFHRSKPFAGATSYPEAFCLPDSKRRKIEVSFAVTQMDEDIVSVFERLEKKICAYLEHFEHALCVNESDPGLSDFEMGDARLVVFKGEPSAALMAKVVFEGVASALADERFISLAGRVHVAGVSVQDDEFSWAEYVE